MLLEVKSPPKHVEIPKSTEITEIRKSKIENPKKNRPIKKKQKNPHTQTKKNSQDPRGQSSHTQRHPGLEPHHLKFHRV
jgi:hypothetical protein